MKHVRLTSMSNPLVREALALREARERRKQHACIVVGEKALEEARTAGSSIQQLFFRDDILNPETYANDTPWVVASTPILKELGETQSPSPVLAIVGLPPSWRETTLEDLPRPTTPNEALLVLDGIQDPGNLGTLLRSACAFGIQRILIIEPAADAFSPKALRSATGLQFRLNLHHVRGETSFDVLNALQALGWNITLADMLEGEGETAYATHYTDTALGIQHVLHSTQAPTQPTALVLGQEGQGLRLHPLDRHTFNRLSIAMEPDVDSLNVAITGSIILHHWYTHTMKQSGTPHG
jgi:RNA methyltransferase, TrmH family